jgi:NADPH2:quinone reductase
MKAALFRSNGAARDVLEIDDVATPVPGTGEVLVRVSVSAINPIDVKWRRSLKKPDPNKWIIPHFDGSGVIEDVGTGVASGRIGESVWIYEALWGRAQGTAAQYVVVPSSRAIRLPLGVDPKVGASLGIPALTAHRAALADGPIDGLRVLVTGGAGVVGNAAVQIARLCGAEVIATVSSSEKAEVARRAGAHHVINYRRDDVVEQIKQLVGDIDRVIEVALGSNLQICSKIIASNGVIAAYASDENPEPILPFRSLLYKNATLRHVLVFEMPEEAKTQAIKDVNAWVESGEFTPLLAAEFPLDEIVAAHEAAESDRVGQVVVRIA